MSDVKVQYLVTLCCSMDEVPIRLFDTDAQVKDFCEKNLPIGPGDGRWTPDHPAASAIKVYPCDFSCVYGWNVVKIENGVPVGRKNLWDDAPADADPAVVTAEGMVTGVPDLPFEW